MTNEELVLLRAGDKVIAPAPDEDYQEWEEGEVYELYVSDLPNLLEIRNRAGQRIWYFCTDDVDGFVAVRDSAKTALLLT